MKVILKTDFIDIYDHFFDKKPTKERDEPMVTFHRFSRTSMGRRQAFKRLEEMNKVVVPHGMLHDMRRRYQADEFIVYTDEYAHRGEGKKLISDGPHPDVFSSLYINRFPSVSMRELIIGSKGFALQYTSDHDWKSNVGNVEIEFMGEFEPEEEYGPYPLYAIDYVMGDTWWAVDLNTAPLIKHTGIDISNEDIVKEIKGWYERMYEL